MENAIIVGWGTTGKATAEAFGIKEYYSRRQKTVELSEVKNFRYIFICLPTPVDVNGKYETQDIEDIIKEVATENNIIILRSTVYPGFSRFLSAKFGVNIVFNPEFLSEDTSIEDAKNPTHIVIGSDNPRLAKDVEGIYRGRFSRIDPIITDSITAEFMKLGLNGFFTTKVVFANEMFDYSKKVGANYETFKSFIESHPWGSKNHFEIFHKGGRGAGGKCLKKDMSALSNYAGSSLFNTVFDINDSLLEESSK